MTDWQTELAGNFANEEKTVNKRQACMVTTAHRGVFFGYRDDDGSHSDDSKIMLYDARMCVSWSTDMHGVLGLASIGPSASCRIGPAVPQIELCDITAVVLVSDAARDRWESEPWKL